MRVKYTILLWLAVALAAVGCGSQGGSETSMAVNRIPNAAASKVKSGMSRREVLGLLGHPVLTTLPNPDAAGGCSYYAMRGRPLTDVWQFCFDAGGRVSSGVALHPVSPPPPASASAGRAALIGRADSICQAERAELAKPVRQLNQRLSALRRSGDQASRQGAVTSFISVDDALRKAYRELAAFNPPSDRQAALAAYLNALGEQTNFLADAVGALSASQDRRYAGSMRRFNALGEAATAHARRYGFSSCAGITLA